MAVMRETEENRSARLEVEKVARQAMLRITEDDELSVHEFCQEWGLSETTWYRTLMHDGPISATLLAALVHHGLLAGSYQGTQPATTPMFFQAADGCGANAVYEPLVKSIDGVMMQVRRVAGFDIRCEDVDGRVTNLRLSRGLVRALRDLLAQVDLEGEVVDGAAEIDLRSAEQRAEDALTEERDHAACRPATPKPTGTGRRGKVNVYLITGVPGHADPVPMTHGELKQYVPEPLHKNLSDRLRRGVRDLEGLSKASRAKRKSRSGK